MHEKPATNPPWRQHSAAHEPQFRAAPHQCHSSSMMLQPPHLGHQPHPAQHNVRLQEGQWPEGVQVLQGVLQAAAQGVRQPSEALSHLQCAEGQEAGAGGVQLPGGLRGQAGGHGGHQLLNTLTHWWGRVGVVVVGAGQVMGAGVAVVTGSQVRYAEVQVK